MRFILMTLTVFLISIGLPTSLGLIQDSIPFPTTYSESLEVDSEYVWSYNFILYQYNGSMDPNIVSNDTYLYAEIESEISVRILKNPNDLNYVPFLNYDEYFEVRVDDILAMTWDNIYDDIFQINYDFVEYPMIFPIYETGRIEYFVTLSELSPLQLEWSSHSDPQIYVDLGIETVSFSGDTTSLSSSHTHRIFDYAYDRSSGIMIEGSYNGTKHPDGRTLSEPIILFKEKIKLIEMPESVEPGTLNTSRENDISASAPFDVAIQFPLVFISLIPVGRKYLKKT